MLDQFSLFTLTDESFASKIFWTEALRIQFRPLLILHGEKPPANLLSSWNDLLKAASISFTSWKKKLVRDMDNIS